MKWKKKTLKQKAGRQRMESHVQKTQKKRKKNDYIENVERRKEKKILKENTGKRIMESHVENRERKEKNN